MSPDQANAFLKTSDSSEIAVKSSNISTEIPTSNHKTFEVLRYPQPFFLSSAEVPRELYQKYFKSQNIILSSTFL
jgi:hypothetical protein